MTNIQTSKLILDDSLMLQSNLQGRGLYPEKIKEINEENNLIYHSLQQELIGKKVDFVNLSYDKTSISLCKEMWSKYASWTKNVLFIGIGGALQTAQFIYNAFPPKNDIQIIFAGNYSDPDEVKRLEKLIKGKEEETTIVVLSKSGTTAEPASIYLHFKKLFQTKLRNDWKKHFLFVTSPTEGIFIKEVKSEGINFIPSSTVGDRFAPFSTIGILPAAIFGMDIQSFLNGGKDFFEQSSKIEQSKNIAWLIAMYQYLYQNLYGINAVVSFIYQARLTEFNMWLRQMWGESLGKEGKGIILYPAMGPKDQHSVLQMFNDGPWFSTFIFISQKKYLSDITVENHGVTELNHFHNKSLQYVTNSSCRNTQLTLKNYQRPSLHLQFETLDEETLGSLVALFELVVVYLGKLFGLQNVFDQPGVTESRQFIDASMNRAGSTEAQNTLQNLEKSIKMHTINYP